METHAPLLLPKDKLSEGIFFLLDECLKIVSAGDTTVIGKHFMSYLPTSLRAIVQELINKSSRDGKVAQEIVTEEEYPVEFSCYKFCLNEKEYYFIQQRSLKHLVKLGKQIEKTTKNIAIIEQMSESLHNVQGLVVFLKKIFEGIKNMGYEGVSIFLINQEDETLECYLSTKLKKNEVNDFRILLKNNNGIIWTTIVRKEAVLIKDIADPNNKLFVDEKLIYLIEGKGVLSLPLIMEGNVKGLLIVHHNINPHTTNQEIEMLELCAHNATVAINRALLYDQLNTITKRLKGKVREATLRLRAQNVRLREVDNMKSQLLSIISHELRTPLTNIKGYTSLLRRGKFGELAEIQKKPLEIIHAESEELDKVIKDVLDLSRLVSKKESVLISEGSIIDLIKECTTEFTEEAKLHNIVIQTHFDALKGTLCFDRDKMKQVMLNLMSNAIKFNVKGGSISIYVKNSPDHVVVQISDTGIGIKEEDMDKIFDKFYQSEDHMTRLGSGAGVGLSIAKEIIDLHQGEIWVNSKINEFTTFSFTIPKQMNTTRDIQEEISLNKMLMMLDAMHDIGKIMHSQLKLDVLLKRILEIIHELFSYDRIRLYLYDNDKKIIKGRVGIGTPDIDLVEIPLERSPVFKKVNKSMKPEIFAPHGEDALEKQIQIEVNTTFGVIPIILKQQVIGFISFDNIYSKKRILNEDLQLMTTLVNTAGFAIENARLYKRTQRDLEKKSLLYTIAKSANNTKNKKELCYRIIWLTKKIINADAGCIFLDYENIIYHRDHDNKKRILESEKVNELRTLFTPPKRATTKILTPEEQKLMQQNGLPFMKQVIIAPLRTRDKTIGTLCFGRRDTSLQYKGRHIDVANAIGYQTGIYIENLRFVGDMESKVKERSAELIEKNKKLEQLSKQKDEFLGYVSHELRTPLTSVVGYSKLLMNYNLPNEKQEQCLGIIDKEANRLLDMINNFLDISKMEAGKISLQYQDVFINELTKDITSLFSQLTAEKGNIVVHNFYAESAIIADKQKIKQVLINLISNANKFSKNGTISIQTEEDDTRYFIKVSDTGIGIRNEDMHNVFKKFSQIYNPEVTEKGTGLGLAITKLIVEAHQGDISCESTYGKGTTFTVRLPKKQPV